MTEDKFIESYDEYSDAIFRHCYMKTSNRETAKDLVQETFVRAWKHVSEGKEMDNPKAFIYKIANNLIIDWYRKKKSVSLDSMQEGGFDVATTEHERTPEISDGAMAMENFEKLSDIYREVLTLKFVEGLQPKDIAEIIGESENVVSVRINRGIKKLQEIYK